MLPLATDEDVHGNIVRELRRRVPDIDLVRVQDAGLPEDERDDPNVLAWAAREGRVLVTQDKSTMTRHASDRIRAGQPTPGVLVRDETTVTLGEAVENLELVALLGEPEEFRDQVRFLPV